ncbi:MAG TPA: MFS transporter [Terriglobales bacterium]|nr:MFS transporter [Terriglobales bacterium]
MQTLLNNDRSKVSLSAYLRLLRENRNFRRLWIAQIVSEIGDWFYTLAIYTLLLQLTGRASSVGLALMLQVLPITFIAPSAGLVNDRISRKRVMIVADLTRFVIVVSMLLVRSASMVWLVYPLLLMETMMVAFFEPARNSVIPNITSREDVIVANTLSSTTWSVNLVLGAALGGFVAALLGRDAVFVINGLSFLASAYFIGGMHFSEPHADASRWLRLRDLVDYTQMIEGFRYVRKHPRLRATIFAKAGLFVIGPSWVLYTIMGERYFPVKWHDLSPQRGAMLGMSMLMAARGVGAMLGPLAASPSAGDRENRLRLWILVGYVADAIGYFGLGFARSVFAACSWIVLAHSGGSVVWVFSTTLLQLSTEDRYRGRVFAADNAISMLTIAVGAFLVSVFLDHGVSAKTLASAAGVSMLLPATLWAYWIWRNDVTKSSITRDEAGQIVPRV